jgi:muramoyltetrapeptide carboxypeptidase
MSRSSYSVKFIQISTILTIFGTKLKNMFSRRNFILNSAAALSLSVNKVAATAAPKIIKPARLKTGDTVGLVCPAGAVSGRQTIEIIRESMQALGLNVKIGTHAYDRYGYLAGKDTDRAADLNAMFADSAVQAILCVHGGWGCARLLPYLDYKTIRQNPKILIGYSDITALLLGIYAQTGLVTFHGPEGAATWNSFTVNNFRRILIDAEMVTMENPVIKGDNLTQTEDRIETLQAGVTQGRLVGGNLTVLSHLMGSKYLPDWKNCLLFLEDVHENIYSIDRMMTQLKLAGVFDDMNGFVFGKCTKCSPGEGYGSLTFDNLFDDHIRPTQKPAYTGAMIGHISHKFTVPVGIQVELNATKGTIKLLESAVI